MIQYEIIDVSEGIDITKSNESKECMICLYWYFKDVDYKFAPYVCNRYHDLSVMVYDLDDFIILNIKGLIIDVLCVR